MPKVVHKNNDSIFKSFTGTAQSFTRKPYHLSLPKSYPDVLMMQLRARYAVACPFRKSYPDVLVMQPSQARNGDNGTRPLDGSTQRRIFL